MEIKRKYSNMPFTEDEIQKLNDFSKRSAELDNEMMAMTRDMRTKLREFSELESKRSLRCADFKKQFEDSFHPIPLPGQSMSDRNDMLWSIRDAFPLLDSSNEYRRSIDWLYNELDRNERDLSAKWLTKEFRYTLEDLKFYTKYENGKASVCGQQDMSICPFGDGTASGTTTKSNRSNSKTNENLSLVRRRVKKNPVDPLDQWTEHTTLTGKKYWEKPKRMGQTKIEKKKSVDMLASTSTDKIKPMTSTSIYSNPSGSTTRANPSLPKTNQDLNLGPMNSDRANLWNEWNGNPSSLDDKLKKNIKKLAKKAMEEQLKMYEAKVSSLKRDISSGSKVKGNVHNPETKVNIDEKFNEGLDMFYVKLKIIFTFLGLFYVSMILFV